MHLQLPKIGCAQMAYIIIYKSQFSSALKLLQSVLKISGQNNRAED